VGHQGRRGAEGKSAWPEPGAEPGGAGRARSPAVGGTGDERKDLASQRKHGISFARAVTVFYDEHGLLLADPAHSQEED